MSKFNFETIEYYLKLFLLLRAVPPDPVVIFDETGTRRTTFVGPYLTGDSMTLVCDAFSGTYHDAKKIVFLLILGKNYRLG